MTTLFSHPRQPRRNTAATVPAAPTRPTSRRPTLNHAGSQPRPGPLQRPSSVTRYAAPQDAVPSFIPPSPSLELRPSAATWDAIASTSRQIRRSEATTVPSNIATLGRVSRCTIRAFDVVTSTLLIALTLPLMVLVGLAVGLTSRGPMLYVSWRIGRGGNIFGCMKFRTMNREADAALPHMLAANPRLAAEYRVAHSLRHDDRVTPIGRWLRRTHLDELPQLFNVLTGKMSLVGPRPIVPSEMGLYGPSLAEALMVKPGITGAWQVSKRLGGYAGRVESDLRYVDQRSIFVDVWICLRTILLVLGIGRRSNR